MKRFAALLGLGVLGFQLSATAAPIKDSAGAVYIDELTPNGKVTIGYSGGTKTINANSDSCGRVVVRHTATNPVATVTSLTVNGTATSVGGLTTETLPRCLNGESEVPRPTNFRLPDGSIVLVNQDPVSQVAIGFPGISLTRSATVNACGFVRLTTSAQYPLSGTLQVNGDPVNVDTMSVGNPPRCIQNILYVPATP